MATAIGEARLILELGHSKFVVRAQAIGKETSATQLLRVLPMLARDMEAQLERVRTREQQAADVVTK
jgi:hypothetical protein